VQKKAEQSVRVSVEADQDNRVEIVKVELSYHKSVIIGTGEHTDCNILFKAENSNSMP
jgi:hypothetical protein